jgi:hypothetical protein
MRYQITIILISILLVLSGCHSGSSGNLKGCVVDGFGNPLGGPGVTVTLSSKEAIHHPDQWGNFFIYAPVGDYEMTIAFSNPTAGYDFTLDENVRIVNGTQDLGTFTLLNAQNFEAWDFYRQGFYPAAINKFNEQAILSRTGQVIDLPWMRYSEGEPDQNTLLTQGALSAENGLGWCYSRGLGEIDTAKPHFLQSLAAGYDNYDAMVGLAWIAIGEGDAEAALEYLNNIINEPGIYDSNQIHDSITETDLILVRSLVEFMLSEDSDSIDTAESVRQAVASQGNAGSKNLLEVLDSLR